MAVEPMLSQQRIDLMRKAGWWRDRLLIEFLDQAAERSPDHTAIVDPAQGVRLNYRQLREQSQRIAANLAACGVGYGDVVSFQLPNWWQVAALHLACLHLGAVSSPLIPALRERELSYILALAESRVVVVATRFRGCDHAAMIAGLRPKLPALEHVFSIGDSRGIAGIEDFSRLLEARAPLPVEPRLTANDVIELAFTSGTTGEPKGVMHISNTIVTHVVAVAERLQLGSDDVFLVATPLGHNSGFLWGMLLPIVVGATSVFQDVWNPEVALDLIEAERVTFAMGATPFLADLTDHPNAPAKARSLCKFLSGGAPIPSALVRRATQRLNAKIISCWGMTENTAVTMSRLDDSEDKIFGSDGSPMPGMEIRVLDGADRPLPPGQEGRLQCRGPTQCVGYLKRPDLYRLDADGWFETGDLARIDSDGYVRITGRIKDMIIRGGEKIPVAEIESLLYQHPAIETIAIAAMPDERLGERACAFVTLRPSCTLDLEEMRRYLAAQGTSRIYWPERVEVLAQLPRTETGKIQKVVLREMAKNLPPQDSA